MIKNKKFLLLPSFFAFLLMAKYLFFAPVNGLADNGDFWRVMGPAGIEYSKSEPIPPRYQSFTRIFKIADSQLLASTTGAALPAFLCAKAISLFSENFDLRILASFYLLISIVGLAGLSITFGSWVIAVGFAWMSLEPSHFLYFNSFFSEGFALALFPSLLWALLGTIRTEKKSYALALSATAFCFSASKLQYALVPLLLIFTLQLAKPGRYRLPSLLLAGIFALTLLLSFMPRPEKRTLLMVNRYHAIFTGIAEVAYDPPAVSDALGISQNFQYLNGIGLYDPPLNGGMPTVLALKLEEISLLQLAWVYATSPGSLINSFPKFQTALAVTPLQYLGNFEQSANRPKETLSFSWQYSNFRDAIFASLPWLPWIMSTIFIFIFASQIRANSALSEWQCLAFFLLLHFISQLPILVIGNGFYSAHRLLISARISLDLLILLLAERAFVALKAKNFFLAADGGSP